MTLVVPWVQSAIQCSRWKCVTCVVDKTSRWEESKITSDEKKGGFVSCGPFSIPKCFQTYKIFWILFGPNPILNWLPNFPACFATVADRSAMHSRAGTGKPASGSWLKLSKAGKDYELAAEDRECFLQEVRKDKRDGANLSGWLLVIKMKQIWVNELQDLFFLSGIKRHGPKIGIKSRNSGKL